MTNENNTVERMIEQFQNATPEEREQFAQFFSNMNVNNRNVHNVREFSEQIIKKENVKKTKYVKIMESESVNGPNTSWKI